MNFRIFNARILTMANGFEIIEGELWVEGNKISYVGKTIEDSAVHGKPKTWNREIDANRNLILPGFKNAHTHSGMTFLRSMADDLSLLSWLEQKVLPMEAKLQKGDIYICSILAIMEYLTSGITANFDMYLDMEEIAKASVDTGFRTVLVSGLNRFCYSVDKMKEDVEKYNHYHELIQYRLGFHGEYTNDRTQLEEVAKLAQQLKAPVYTHNSESIAEVEQCIKRTGYSPTVYMDQIGLYEYGGGGYHCVHLNQEDMEIFKRRNMSVITNPASNMKLASGIVPLQTMLEKNINIAIGTDGPASNNCLDMFREMFLVTGLAKIKEKDASAVDANQVLKMATVNGAKAMGLMDCDTLEEGKKADFIMLDLHQPNMQPINNITKNIVYSGSKSNVAMTVINGKILYENGIFHIGISPEEVYQKVQEIALRVRQ